MPSNPQRKARAPMSHAKSRIGKVERLIDQAEFIGWLALAESFKRDLAALKADPTRKLKRL